MAATKRPPRLTKAELASREHNTRQSDERYMWAGEYYVAQDYTEARRQLVKAAGHYRMACDDAGVAKCEKALRRLDEEGR